MRFSIIEKYISYLWKKMRSESGSERIQIIIEIYIFLLIEEKTQFLVVEKYIFYFLKAMEFVEIRTKYIFWGKITQFLDVNENEISQFQKQVLLGEEKSLRG
eukprot:TRINITY_DN142674_c0_g1_i1.p1 TRINITY_DN142674_c0_g1~~TRINITY_DN142674_c0_g1_i1.p1  ORF type:complete len:102 (-),score=8.39 TRINITY_DN142674_c0_g1_i1:9-314(-)